MLGWERMVGLTDDPPAVHEDRELAGQGGDRLGFADATDKGFGPAFERGVGVRAEVSMGCLDEQAAQFPISRLGDPPSADGVEAGRLGRRPG